MRKVFILFLLLCSCSSKKTANNEPTYRDCVQRQDSLREARFKAMPEALQKIAGKHSVVKYFEKRPKDLASIVKQLQGENAIFNARKKRDSENDLDLRLLDTSPGRNRVLIGFEKLGDMPFAKGASDKLVLKMDYSKPVIGYYFPLNTLKQEGSAWSGRYKSNIKVKAGQGVDKVLGKVDISIYLEVINKDYLYLEWVNHSYSPDDDENWKGLKAILHTADDDRFLDWEHPYFDNKGELNPEDCNALPGA